MIQLNEITNCVFSGWLSHKMMYTCAVLNSEENAVNFLPSCSILHTSKLIFFCWNHSKRFCSQCRQNFTRRFYEGPEEWGRGGINIIPLPKCCPNPSPIFISLFLQIPNSSEKEKQISFPFYPFSPLFREAREALAFPRHVSHVTRISRASRSCRSSVFR